jgi:hydroxymethylbilane synthase
VPIAGHGCIGKDGFTLTGLVCDVDGSQLIKDTRKGSADQSAQIGLALAEALLSRGAGDILERLNADAP